MLALDSLVIDLMFQANAEIEPETLLEALGGEEIASQRKLLDPDMQDPRFEMELSPSMPFRRRGERRLLIVDDSVAPMRKDPRAEPIIPIDLREEKERLIAICSAAPIRLGRIMALGSWGDAVLVARNARDLRAICLLPWVLDPTVDVDGKKRANRLTQAEFEEKILAFDKRLEELDEKEILADLGPATFVRNGDLLVVDVLEADGTWDLRKSLAMEAALAAIHKFSLIPGAPSSAKAESTSSVHPERGEARSAEPSRGTEKEEPGKKPAPPAKSAGPPLQAVMLDNRVVLIFPAERFDLDTAAAMGKKDFESVIRGSDDLPGQLRDRVYEHGAGFIAPLEFLSEVFVDGVPLSRPQFDQNARPINGGTRVLDVHCPRFGPVLLLDVPDQGRFISSERTAAEKLVELIAKG